MKGRAGTGRRPVLHQWLLLAITVVLVCGAVLLPGPVPVLGNLHDVFIPLNAAAAIEHGLRLHADILSPFGHVYFWLHYAAWQAHQVVAPDASAIGILTTASFIFALGLMALLSLARFVLGPNPLTAPWLAALILVLAASPRNQAVFDHKELLWYGLYNNQLWGLVMVLLAMLAVLVARSTSRERLRASRPARAGLVAVLTCCLYVTLHYKVNFFLAAAFVSLSILLVTGYREGLRAGVWIFAWLVLAVLATWLAGYDYVGYLADLANAAEAKQQTSVALTRFMAAALPAALAAVVLLASGTRRQGPRVTEDYAIVSVPVVLATLGVALGVLGDFSGTQTRFWLLPAFAALAVTSTPQLVRYVAVIFFTTLFLLDALAVARSIELRYRAADARFERVAMGAPPYQVDVLLEAPDYRTSSTLGRLSGLRAEALVGVASFAPSLGLTQIPENWNVRYARARDDAARWLQANAPGLAIGEVEFVDGVSWLNGRAPSPGPHWVHEGTTIPSRALPRLWQWYSRRDIILVPVLSVDGPEQLTLACNFFRFNRRHNYPFEIVRVTPDWLYFVAREKSEAFRNPALKPWREYDRRIAQGNCRARAQSIW